MLRKIRIALAAVFFVFITLLFFGIGQDWFGWMAKLQFLPAVFRVVGGATLFNVLVVAGILLLTFIFGRIYCSVICPMGVYQDIVIWIRRKGGSLLNDLHVRSLRRKKEKSIAVTPKKVGYIKRFSHRKEHKLLRYGILIVLIASIFVIGQLLISLFAPYSAYGRMVRTIAGVGSGESLAPVLIITACITFLVITVCAWIWGREWCSSVCPVGTVLGTVSRYSLFRPVVDTDKCIRCGRCYNNCKAGCIDPETMLIDGSRCVDCFDCIDNCQEGGLKFRRAGKAGRKASAAQTIASGDRLAALDPTTPLRCVVPPLTLPRVARVPEATAARNEASPARRTFLKTSAAAITAIAAGGTIAKAQNMKLDGGLAEVVPKASPERDCRIVPPGAGSEKDFYSRCTACQLCVSACPNGVLRPGTDLAHLLQPQMGYENGWCRPECTACSDVCPAGAIRPVTRDEKTLIRIGTARVNPVLCLAASGEASCGNCAYHCPTGAVTMQNVDGIRRPVVAEEQCIGCGACEYLCPSRPISAITVNGLSTQQNK
jgi:polyferredoxin